MDELDREILKILIKDARTPFIKIGKMLGVSKDQVKRRYTRIKQRNSNLKSTLILDFEKMGFKNIMGFSIKTCSEADVPKVKAKLFDCPKRGYLSEQIGDFDFYFDVYLTKIEEIYEVMEYLRQIEGIQSLNPWCYLLNPDETLPYLNETLIYTMK